jgi:methylamine dehydrogenase heavy chain
MTKTIPVVSLTMLALLLAAPSIGGPLQAETVGKSVLPEPQPSWLLLHGSDASHIFDATDGQMQGLISHTPYTTAIVTLPARKEAYFVDSFYSRGVRGERSDVLTVVDMVNLAPIAEIDIPDKAAALRIRHHIGLLDDQRHLIVFNMTPGQSVSVVDVVDREFVGEISTPGCAIIMPSGPRGFLMLCGDGTLQLILLDENGAETDRVRTRPFFVVEEDAVFDRVVKSRAGWMLISHEGLVREVTVEGRNIKVGEAWSMASAEELKKSADAEKKWRPGGQQPFTLHLGTGLLYSLMHEGKVDTQDADGGEIWIFDPARRKRVGKLVLPVEASGILTSQEPEPRLYVYDKDRKLHVYDGRLLRHLRTIEKPGTNGPLLQTLTPHD